MDHKLAIVIVPQDSRDPIGASKALLERFQKVPLDNAPDGFEQKFRYKRVGGWFDGLLRGETGGQRWSSVLRMMFDGSSADTKSKSSGLDATRSEIQGRIEASNTIALADVSPLAPCTIVVTPDGQWFADANPDNIDEAASANDVASAPAWPTVKTGLFEKYRGFMAVAWDLSWYFLGTPEAAKESKKPASAGWSGFSKHTVSKTEAWTARIASARRLVTTQQASHDKGYRDASGALGADDVVTPTRDDRPLATGAMA